jgi:membrane-associated protease RseP (regulator of RpoE activity)
MEQGAQSESCGRNKDRTVVVALVAGIIALLFGLCAGAALGGAGGYLAGRRSTSRIEESTLPRFLPPGFYRWAPGATPAPRLPGVLPPGAPVSSGALVQEVVPGSPAAAAGIKFGDLITRVDDTPVGSKQRLADIVKQHAPGDPIALEVWRAGDTRIIKVTLGENPGDESLGYLGIRFVELGD